MKNFTILLFLGLTLLSCGRNTDSVKPKDTTTPAQSTPPVQSTPTYVYTDSGRKFDESRFPLKVYVSREKYERYQTQFDNVERDVRSESGKQLVEFIPSNNDPKFSDKWDSLSLFSDSNEMWVLFKEDSNQFTNIDEESAAEALTWTYENGIIHSAQIVMDFTIDGQWNDYNFNQVLYHETLHILGFEHTFVNDPSVMNYDYVYNIDGMTYEDDSRVTQKYNFSLKWDHIKDLEKIGGAKEVLDREAVASQIEETYGLSEERSLEVAKILNGFKRIKDKRSLTDADRNIMSKILIGIDFKTAKLALEDHVQGNPDKLEEILEKAAEVNETSPEHIHELVGEFLLK